MKKVLLIFLALCLCSCATIGGSRSQHIAVSTFYKGMQLDGVSCDLTNDKGTWNLTSQGSAMVQKSFRILTITCKKEGYPDGLATLSSTTKNLLVKALTGGVVGNTVDAASEAMFEYPNYVTIYMGQTVTIER